MAPVLLKLTIMAADGLKNVSLLGGKMNPYAVAFVNPSAKRSTRVLRRGGTDPVWNDNMEIEVEDHLFYDANSSLTIQVFSRSSLTTSLVGSTRVLLRDIVLHKATKDIDGGDVFTLQLWRPSGRPYGFVRLFLEIDGDFSQPAFAYSQSPVFSDEPATGIPVSYAQAYPSSYAPSYMPVPCHPLHKEERYRYSTPYNGFAPSQRRKSNFTLGILTGALAGVLLASIF